MNVRLTIIVVVIALIAGIAALVKINMGSNQGAGDQGPAAATRLLSPEAFDPDAVRGITLEKEGEGRWVFAKEAEGWTMTEPLRARMNDFSLRYLATSAADLTIASTIEPGELKGDLTAEKLGFKPAKATITFDTEDTQVRIELGRLFTDEQAYARIEPDGNVYVVGDKLHRRIFENDVNTWRERRIFDNITTDASRLTFERTEGGKTVHLARVDGRWMMQAPIQTRADQNAVAATIQRLGTMSVDSLIDDAPSDVGTYGLVDPWAVITVETDSAGGGGAVETKSEVLMLGHRFDLTDEARYGQYRGRPSVFKVAGASVKILTPEPTALIAKTPTSIERHDVQQVAIDGPDGPFVIKRQLDGWIVSVEGGADQPGEVERINTLLGLLTSPASAVRIGSGEQVPGSFLARASVEGLSGRTSPPLTIHRHQEGETVEIILADGSGALRIRSAEAMVEFTADAYVLTDRPGNEDAGVEGPPREPVK